MNKKSEVHSSIQITNMGAENFKFALHCFEEAKKAQSTNDKFAMWAFGRSAIVSLIVSVEADFSRLIEVLLKRKKQKGITLSPSEQKLYVYLTLPNTKPNHDFNTLLKKYNRLRTIKGLRKAKKLPVYFQDVVNMRNKMIHYMNQYNTDAYRMDMVQKVQDSITQIRSFILHIWKLADEGVPSWVN